MGGVAAVFFAYIGFDAVSTLAEEAKNPQRDLPRGMIYSLVICTTVYIILSLVLTGMVSFDKLGVSDPLAEVFKLRGVKWVEFLVSISAVVAMTSVLLVFQMGQPRIWMSMSRDGLMPKVFQTIHPRFKTPSFSTIVTGLVVGIPLFFTNEKFVLDFTSIGTLFAFVLVCGGVLLLPPKPKEKGRFHLPYINGQYIFPLAVIGAGVIISVSNPGFFLSLLDVTGPDAAFAIPMLVFSIICVILAVFTFVKRWSLIPLLGLVSCLYLLTGMELTNWRWFFIWFLIGLVIYFSYGFRKSKLAAGQ
jgi:amino acid transporter